MLRGVGGEARLRDARRERSEASFTAGPTCFSTLDDSPAAPPKRATQSWVNFLHTLVDRIHAHVLSLSLFFIFSLSFFLLFSRVLRPPLNLDSPGYEILFIPIHPSSPPFSRWFLCLSLVLFVWSKIEVTFTTIVTRKWWKIWIVNFCNAVNDFKLKDIVKLFTFNRW